MDTKKLRQKILDLAIRGKLVPQDPNDEPASILLERIRAEKERLIAEGKIKRPKKSKTTSSESHYQNFEPPFEIPDGWIWIKLSDCCHIVGRIGFRGYTKDDLVCESDGAITLSPSNIVDGKMDYASCTYISWKKYNESPEIQIRENDILLVKTGSSYGKCALVNNLPKEATINPQYVVLKYISVVPLYLTYILQSNYARECFDKFVLGTAIPTFTQEKLGNLVIPLPPYREQLKIVNKINELQGYVSNLYDYFRNLSISITKVKSKILELAMEGKLVPQDPADESAAEMLKRINPKANIITDNPHSWNIPNGWCLCELRDLCTFLSRGKSPKYSDVPNQYPVFAQKCNLKDGGISLNQARFLDESTLPKWPNKYKLKDQDILVNSTGTGTVGRTRLFLNKYLKDFPFVLPDSHVSVVRTFDEIDSKFIYYNLISREGQTYFNDNLSGSTNQKELYIETIGNKLIFLPPKKEQEWIVARIEELYHCIDKIEASLQS